MFARKKFRWKVQVQDEAGTVHNVPYETYCRPDFQVHDNETPSERVAKEGAIMAFVAGKKKVLFKPLSASLIED